MCSSGREAGGPDGTPGRDDGGTKRSADGDGRDLCDEQRHKSFAEVGRDDDFPVARHLNSPAPKNGLRPPADEAQEASSLITSAARGGARPDDSDGSAGADGLCGAQEMAVDDFDEFDEDSEELLGDFDPYVFMKLLRPKGSEAVAARLPPRAAASPVLDPLRRMLGVAPSAPPAKRCTLVLDLDETLVHSQMEPRADADFVFDVELCGVTSTVYAKARPHLAEFLADVAARFEVVVFTASHRAYAETLLDRVDPGRNHIDHRLFRDACATVDGLYLKDLDVLGRDLATVALVDNTPYVFAYQPDNAVPIESWYDDPRDRGLLELLPLLRSLEFAEDVRPLLREAFHLRDRIEAAELPPGLAAHHAATG
ncbi:HAD-like domain-containing protein [Pelagophyceae sp. CCMP2097]|nr:HAD-like domain-containing protein [Pelagophyceae sp. CCMP2097]|mmetsp:Transcript_25566/g.85890  ORF Transcript_25566/g.85890 Transcript_25566/m.85890 type:complete len:369 (-) Transcript_25566:159-1265(-)